MIAAGGMRGSQRSVLVQGEEKEGEALRRDRRDACVAESRRQGVPTTSGERWVPGRVRSGRARCVKSVERCKECDCG